MAKFGILLQVISVWIKVIIGTQPSKFKGLSPSLSPLSSTPLVGGPAVAVRQVVSGSEVEMLSILICAPLRHLKRNPKRVQCELYILHTTILFSFAHYYLIFFCTR